jgi:hypothetical protein
MIKWVKVHKSIKYLRSSRTVARNRVVEDGSVDAEYILEGKHLSLTFLYCSTKDIPALE